jgi:hypothetical protein
MEYNVDKEKEFLQKKIDYNNNWNGSQIWRTELQDQLDKRLASKGFKQILVPVQLKADACDILFKQENARLARLLSNIVDIYDELPYRPDVAFDLAWRAFEILLKTCCNNHDATKCLPIIAKEISFYANSNTKVADCLENIIAAQSLGSLTFCVNLFVKNNSNDVPDDFNLMYAPNTNKITSRLKSALEGKKDINDSTFVYDMYVARYFNDDYYNKIKAK